MAIVIVLVIGLFLWAFSVYFGEKIGRAKGYGDEGRSLCIMFGVIGLFIMLLKPYKAVK